MEKLGDLYSNQIDKKLKRFKQYGGCYPCYKLPKKMAPGKFYVVNMDEDPNGAGTHWVMCSSVEKDRVIYVDSFGMRPNTYITEFLFTLGRRVWYNDMDIQAIRSNACGYFCCFICEQIAKGRTVESILKDFTQNTSENEQLLNNYFSVG